ncbi:unnamed protein product [Oikopleura dioica]|uniref:Uncharacterized protein n=1 Tax=Oikopleura dioica TaxID=34765 RepID=E4WV95_OIKDI|nr:unnamed protein product [Oikopleura dioica]CBY31958.1 unnamed protein product [Oikopleura dioica]
MPRPPRNGERQKKTNSCFERCFGVKEPLSRISVRVKKKFTEKRRSRINSISENRELEHASVKSGYELYNGENPIRQAKTVKKLKERNPEFFEEENVTVTEGTVELQDSYLQHSDLRKKLSFTGSMRKNSSLSISSRKSQIDQPVDIFKEILNIRDGNEASRNRSYK